jgi:glyoxylase-like metal-dependent hydrolase (beta-lactamase superfamily II)
MMALRWRKSCAQPTGPQHHDQVPGFYRLKVGDLEVTALLDGPALLDLHWLTGEKATLDGVVNALNEEPLSIIYITHEHADHFLGLEVFRNSAVVDRINNPLDASTAVDFTENYLSVFEEELKKAKIRIASLTP